MTRQDWVDLAWWMCFAGAFIFALLLAYAVSFVAIDLFVS